MDKNRVRFVNGPESLFPNDVVDRAALYLSNCVVEYVAAPEQAEALAEVLDMMGLVPYESTETGCGSVYMPSMEQIKGYLPKARSGGKNL